MRSSSGLTGSPQKVDFFARYHLDSAAPIDELDEFLKLRREPFGTCDPVKWWAARVSQFPRLSAMARDTLAIPGQFRVLVHIFVYSHLYQAQLLLSSEFSRVAETQSRSAGPVYSQKQFAS